LFEFLEDMLRALAVANWEPRGARGAAEPELPASAAPQIRRLRWIERGVLLAYVAAMAAIPILVIKWCFPRLWLFLASGGFVVTLIMMVYGMAVIVGFVALQMLFRRKRLSIATRAATATIDFQ
jgi:uncharacterized membrane protein